MTCNDELQKALAQIRVELKAQKDEAFFTSMATRIVNQRRINHALLMALEAIARRL